MTALTMDTLGDRRHMGRGPTHLLQETTENGSRVAQLQASCGNEGGCFHQTNVEDGPGHETASDLICFIVIFTSSPLS